MKKTKIITTVWPATDSLKKLQEMYEAWANIIRLNFSHGNHDYFQNLIENIKKLNFEWKTNFSILLDNKWPEIRTKKTDEIVELEKWEKFLMTTILNETKIIDNKIKKIVCNYEYLIEDLEIWRIIDIDSGLLKVKVIEKQENALVCETLNSHKIKSLRHVNLPWIILKLPWITSQDKKDIIFWLQNGIDFIALSFVRNKNSIREVKEIMKQYNREDVKIISKIENQEALDNIDDIIDESDWLMIARWDLWSEVDLETLPVLQKMLWDKCKISWKFFIVATQMLESMIENPVPTRAEVNDIYTACLQAADCLMLSGESAAWKYPIEAVSQMSKIIKYSETQIKHSHSCFSKDLWDKNDKKYLLKNWIYLAENIEAKAIIVFTRRWFMARTLASYRPNIPVYAFVSEEALSRKLNILYSINAFKIEKKSNEEIIENAINYLRNKILLKTWDRVVTLYDIESKWNIIPSIQVRTI